ncbi:MAG: hypothetical protein DWP94_05470 [Flavobacterium sp.]|nr:MAG: hypothetical protein DWP94_05470 [Flavobacterium sp.]
MAEMKFIKFLTKNLSGLTSPIAIARYTEDRSFEKRTIFPGSLKSILMATVYSQLGRTANQSSLRVKERFQSIDFEITHDPLLKGIQGISRIAQGIDFHLKQKLIIERIVRDFTMIMYRIFEFSNSNKKLNILPKKLYLPCRSLQFYNNYLRINYVLQPFGGYKYLHT